MRAPSDRWRGPAVGLALLVVRNGALAAALALDPTRWHAAGAIAYVLLQSWLSTGLFITAHEAMHGSAAPGRPTLNRWLGTLSLWTYALFGYERLLEAHHRHHDAPATPDDPDFAPTAFWPWLGAFMTRYLRWLQVVGLVAFYQGLVSGLGLSHGTVLVAWAVPAWLSILQLFVFGTWLPHREPPGGRDRQDAHHAVSTPLPVWASLMTCFHFGYHWEHHASPGTPWYRLPTVRRARLEVAAP